MRIAAIPAYNEGATIGSVIIKASQFVDKIIVIDDGSSDDTAEVAKLAGAEVITHKENKGYGGAIQSCIHIGKEHGADVLVILDSDGQHDANEIPRVIAPIENGEADIVNGSRFLTKHSTSEMPRYRQLGNKALTKVMQLGIGSAVTDSQSGYRAYSKKALHALNPASNGMCVGSEILVLAQEKGLRIHEVPIHCRYNGLNGSSENATRHGLGVLNFLAKQIKIKHPILFFGLPGLVFIILGLIFGFTTVAVYRSTEYFPIGKAVLAVLFMIIGTMAGFAALILDTLKGYFARLKFIEVKQRPILLFGLPGAIFIAMGLGIGIFTANLYYHNESFAIGWALVAILLLVVGTIAVVSAVVIRQMQRLTRFAH